MTMSEHVTALNAAAVALNSAIAAAERDGLTVELSMKVFSPGSFYVVIRNVGTRPTWRDL